MILANIFFAISITLALSSILLIINRKYREKPQNLLLLMIILISISIFFIAFPTMYQKINDPSLTGIFQSTGHSFVHMMQTISLDAEYNELLNTDYFPLREWGTESLPGKLYIIHITVLNAISPLLAGSFLLVFIMRLFAKVVLFIYPLREKYLFSELNVKTICMGENIRAQNPQSIIVYTNSRIDNNDESWLGFFDRAKKIKAVCTEGDIVSLKLAHDRKTPITIVLASVEETANLMTAAALADSKKLLRFLRVSMYVFITHDESENILQKIIYSKSNNSIRIFPINDCNITINRLLFEHPLYSRITGDLCSVLIIGCDDYGMEAIKAVFWCGQMTGIRLVINVVSEDATDKFHLLKQKCPELFSSGDYAISFHSCNIDTDELTKYLNTSSYEVNYVLVSRGSDKANISSAMTLARLFDTMHLDGSTAPIICFLVENQNIYNTYSTDDLRSIALCESLLVPFGCDCERFDISAIMNSTLEKMALRVHMTYYKLEEHISESIREEIKKFLNCGGTFTKGSEPEFIISNHFEYSIWKCFYPENTALFMKIACLRGLLRSLFRKRNEISLDVCKELAYREQVFLLYSESIYNRHSSYSSALHLLYKLPAAGIMPVGRLPTVEELDAFSIYISDSLNKTRVVRTEHLRWNAFIRTLGYRCPTPDEFDAYAFKNGNTHHHKRLKLHPCLVNWSENVDMPLCESDFELFDKKNPDFLNGRYIDELDELDRVSLRVSYVSGKRKDYKKDDEVIIAAINSILGNAESGWSVL